MAHGEGRRRGRVDARRTGHRAAAAVTARPRARPPYTAARPLAGGAWSASIAADLGEPSRERIDGDSPWAAARSHASRRTPLPAGRARDLGHPERPEDFRPRAKIERRRGRGDPDVFGARAAGPHGQMLGDGRSEERRPRRRSRRASRAPTWRPTSRAICAVERPEASSRIEADSSRPFAPGRPARPCARPRLAPGHVDAQRLVVGERRAPALFARRARRRAARARSRPRRRATGSSASSKSTACAGRQRPRRKEVPLGALRPGQPLGARAPRRPGRPPAPPPRPAIAASAQHGPSDPPRRSRRKWIIS